MRCKNCGWPNKPQVKVCVKCHAPLDASDDDQNNYPQSNNHALASDEPNLKKTVMESDAFGDAPETGGSNDVDSALTAKACPKCGYALRPNVSKCPNCGYSVSQMNGNLSADYDGSQYKEHVDEKEPAHRPTRMQNTNRGNVKLRGTVNPYMMNMEMEPLFYLKPLKRMNERRDFDDLEFEGKEVVLNRDNTESNNASITSHEQAIISRNDGHWYIEDRSEQKTTFVQAGSKIELHDGDIILLGNRMSEFHE